MEYKKIENLLGIDADNFTKPKYSTKKSIEIFDQSNGSYSVTKDIRFKTSQLRNDLCDFNDAYIAVTGKITATNPDPPDDIHYGGELALKNSEPFFNCILKINSQLIEDAQDLDIVNPLYNLLYCSKNLKKNTESPWNYYTDIPNSEYAGNNERARIFYPIIGSKSFDYKTRLVGELSDGENELEDIKIVVPLKNLSNFMFNLDFLMINS